jgi:hypothetical protein
VRPSLARVELAAMRGARATGRRTGAAGATVARGSPSGSATYFRLLREPDRSESATAMHATITYCGA